MVGEVVNPNYTQTQILPVEGEDCAGLNPQNRAHQIRACTRYTNQTFLYLSGLVHSLGDPELHWVDPKGRSHVTYPYWLVTQSVTSYIRDQRALLGSVIFGS